MSVYTATVFLSLVLEVLKKCGAYAASCRAAAAFACSFDHLFDVRTRSFSRIHMVVESLQVLLVSAPAESEPRDRDQPEDIPDTQIDAVQDVHEQAVQTNAHDGGQLGSACQVGVYPRGVHLVFRHPALGPMRVHALLSSPCRANTYGVHSSVAGITRPPYRRPNPRGHGTTAETHPFANGAGPLNTVLKLQLKVRNVASKVPATKPTLRSTLKTKRLLAVGAVADKRIPADDLDRSVLKYALAHSMEAQRHVFLLDCPKVICSRKKVVSQR